MAQGYLYLFRAPPFSTFVRVLIADDDRLSRAILAETVQKMGHEVVLAGDGKEALALLEDGSDIRMAILDWTMPHLDGPEVCARVRARKTGDYVHLTLVSARSKPEHVLAGLEAGADDYVAKPFSPIEVHARVRAAERLLAYHAKSASLRAQLDQILANLDCGVLLSSADGRVAFANPALAELLGLPEAHAVGRLREEVMALVATRAAESGAFLAAMLEAPEQPVEADLELSTDGRTLRWETKRVALPEGPARLDVCRDVTAEKRLAHVLEEKATRDHLTGLYNRRGGEEHLAREAARAARFATPVGLLLVDIDHFKNVNDTHGHAMGDRVLVEVAQAIAKQLRAYDHAIRWGGEEMLVVLPETSSFYSVRVAERIRAAIAELRVDGTLGVTVSIGVAELHRDGPDVERALGAADAALYAAKHGGRNRVCRTGEQDTTLPPPHRKRDHSNPPP